MSIVNVFDIGVTVKLVNQVTPGLAQIAAGFATTATAAEALQKQVTGMKTALHGAMQMATASAVFAAPLVAANGAAKEYLHQLNRMTVAGLTNKELALATATAWGTAKNVLGSTATGNLEITSDLKTVLGKMNEAVQLTPMMSKMQVALGSVMDGKMSAEQLKAQNFAAAKSADSLGKIDPATFSKTMNDFFKVSAATYGRILPSDMQNTIKFAKLSKMGWSEDYRNKVMPELMVEAKGKGGGTQTVGTQSMALYRFGVQGVMNKQSMALLKGLGLVGKGDGLKTTTTGTTLAEGMSSKGLLASNPFEWVQTVFKPALMKKYGLGANANDALVQASNQVFKSNSGAGNLVAEFLKKPQQYQRFASQFDKADGIEAGFKRVDNDPDGAEKRLHSAFNNLNTAIGKNITPTVTTLTNKLAKFVNELGAFANEHPRITKTVSAMLGAASAIFAAGTAANLAKASFLGLKIAMGPPGTAFSKLGDVFKGPLAANVGTFLLGLTKLTPQTALIGLAVAGVVTVFMNLDNILKTIHTNADFLTVCLYRADKAFDDVGKTIQKFCNQVGSTASGMLASVANNPLIKALAGAAKPATDALSQEAAKEGRDVQTAFKQVKDGLQKGIAVDKTELAKAKAYEMQHGHAGIVNWIYDRKGQIAKPSMPGRASTQQKVVNNTTYTIAPNAINVHGGDAKANADAVMKRLDTKFRHASSATSAAGGGVDVSRHSYGNG